MQFRILLSSTRKSQTRFLIRLVLMAVTIFYLSPASATSIIAPTSFPQLPDWTKDNQLPALHAFQQSCQEILQRPVNTAFGTLPEVGRLNAWQKICRYALQLDHPTALTARRFFEQWFKPYAVKNYLTGKSLFTGYYLPLLHGSLQQSRYYSVPVYGLPDNLVLIKTSNNKTLVRLMRHHVLFPIPDRQAISAGALKDHAPVLLWVNNPIDLFFAEIQGSAQVVLPNHRRLFIGYAGGNGWPYTAIGKVLVEEHALAKENVSMVTIRDWLAAHPKQVSAILNRNASYVFFKMLNNPNPLGSEKVPLTPERSLAIDQRYIPFGAPLWLNTMVPKRGQPSLQPYRHLLIAQDTGGAITGIVRGDIYWGAGDDATFAAARMNSPGQYWILLPSK